MLLSYQEMLLEQSVGFLIKSLSLCLDGREVMSYRISLINRYVRSVQRPFKVFPYIPINEFFCHRQHNRGLFPRKGNMTCWKTIF